jgi:hypothetical protein
VRREFAGRLLERTEFVSGISRLRIARIRKLTFFQNASRFGVDPREMSENKVVQ